MATRTSTEQSAVQPRERITAQALYRLAAIALVISGLSLALGMVLHPTQPLGDHIATTEWAMSHLLWWIGGMTGVLGLTGLYLRQRADVGVLGFIGSGFAILGVALIANAMYFEAFIAPSLAAQAPELFDAYPTGGGWGGFLAGVLAAGALFGVGFILLGIAMYRAESMPTWAIGLAVLGGVPFAVNFLLPHLVAVLAAIVFAIGLAGMGYELWKNSEPPAVNQGV